MLKFFQDLASDQDNTIHSVYGIKVLPDPKYKKKLAQSIETLGQRYALYSPMPKVAK